MKRFLGKGGFALITVFIISTILAGVIGFTFIGVGRQINLKNMFSSSKKTLSVADAGIEQMIRYVQSYHFLTPAEFLAENDSTTPVMYSIGEEAYFDSIMDANGWSGCMAKFDNESDWYPIKDIIKRKYGFEPFQEVDFQEFLNLYKNYYSYNSIPNSILSRAKYYYNYDYINSGKLYKNGSIVNESHSDYKLLSNISVTSEVKDLMSKLRPSGVTYSSGCENCLEHFVNLITQDIQTSYNLWEIDLLGEDLILDVTKSGNNLGKIENMIIDLGGLTASTDPSSCVGLNFDKVVVPYDIDYPVITNIQYEGVILRTADWLNVGEDNTGDHIPDVYKHKLVISAVAYIFDKPVPKTTFDSIKSLFTCSNGTIKREEDKEYKKYADNPNYYNVYLDHRVYINSLDVDKINEVLKNNGYSIKITPVKRAIRGEFEIPYIYETTETPSIDLILGPTRVNILTPNLTYKDYLIATNNYLELPSGEILYGPVRSNNNIDFYGTTWDALLSLKGKKILHKGKFKFIYNGETYTVDLSGWNGAQTDYDAPVTPSLDERTTIKIKKEGEIVYSEDGKNFYRSYYLDIDNNGGYSQGDKIIVNYKDNPMPLTNDTIITNAGTSILSIVNGTQYYINGNGQEVELDFQTNGKIKVTVGKDKYFLDMPINYPQTINGQTVQGGVIYVNGSVDLRGKVDGVVTVYATGDVHIRSDLRYVNDPVDNPNSSLPVIQNIHSLGVITPGKVIVDNNSPNALQLNMNILAGQGFESDKNNPNKIKEFVGSMSFTDTYTAEYRWEWLHFDYDLQVLRPPLFPAVGESDSNPTINVVDLPEKDLVGRISDVKFGRILWREMVNPP